MPTFAREEIGKRPSVVNHQFGLHIRHQRRAIAPAEQDGPILRVAFHGRSHVGSRAQVDAVAARQTHDGAKATPFGPGCGQQFRGRGAVAR